MNDYETNGQRLLRKLSEEGADRDWETIID